MTQARKILIVDDDALSSALLAEFLQEQGFATTVLMNGLHVEPAVRRADPAVVLLDVSLPGLDGIEVCHQLRRFSTVPIIMVSGRTEEIDRTLGLEVGADDYVCKPYGFREIAARIKAQLRRSEGRVGARSVMHGFRIDDSARRIAFEDHWLPLTSQEYRLLRKLLTRPGHVFTREELMDLADDEPLPRAGSERAVDSHVKNLRRKLEAARGEGAAIVSVYGVGYRFDPELSAVR
ncbi:response regulator [Ramlibacter rhizophilus]|uniref:response regulator n=1 Tax=Ramlibacter rhizophilus TaxID=1781167 RepID=UPI001F0D9AAA|nr:response regulator [Ramlibacter rhizophilus]